MSDPRAESSITYLQQYRRCGNPRCRACREGGAGHGPYWYAFWEADGRKRSRYLGKQAPPEMALHAAQPSAATMQEAPTASAPHLAAPATIELQPAAPAPGALRVRTLGDFRVWRDGEQIPTSGWRQRKVAALFKSLLSAPGYRLHREQALELLWPELPPRAASANLRYTLHRLRRLLDLPGGARSHIQSEGDLLLLAPALLGTAPADWLDVAAFSSAATSALAGRDAGACVVALALYTGEYLPADRYEEWAAARHGEVSALRVGLLLHLAELRTEAGDTVEAERVLRQVLALDACHELAARSLMELLAAAGRRVDALQVYQDLTAALRQELGLPPGPDVEALYRRLQTRSSNLPAPLTTFIGRVHEQAVVKDLLAGTRLLTLVGVGGCGKTRLALQVAADLLPSYAAGVWLVDLARLQDPALLPQAIAGTLDVPEQPGVPFMETLIDALQGRRLLLLLDNCEHLGAACGALATRLLTACASLQILATSREELRITGETVWAVPPLSLPMSGAIGTGGRLIAEHASRQGEAGDAARAGQVPFSYPVTAPVSHVALADLAQSEAVQLFVDRARARQPGFTFSQANAGIVAAICRRLEGLPLAIELAAARVGMLALPDLARRLEDRFEVLVSGKSDAPARQQTLRATMEWSYLLLSDAERRLLRRLAVFAAGGWALPAAEAVCGDERAPRTGVPELQAQLTGKSLVRIVEQEHHARYGMLETVRQFAWDRLQAAGEAAMIQDRHLAWYLALATEAEPELRGPEQEAWLAHLAAEHDNLQAALRWALADSEPAGDDAQPVRAAAGLDLASRLWRYWSLRGHLAEGDVWLSQALARGGAATAPARARALGGAGNLAWLQGQYERAGALHQSSLALFRQLGDTQGIADALNSLGLIAHNQAEFTLAATLFEESLALKRTLDDNAGIAVSLINLGTVLLAQGRYTRAEALYEEALARKRALGDRGGIAVTLTNLGALAHDQGDLPRAAVLHQESLALYRALGDTQGMADALGNLGELAYDRGDYAQAEQLLQESLAQYRTLGARLGEAVVLNGLGSLALVGSNLDRAQVLLLASIRIFQELADRRSASSSLLGLALLAAAQGEHQRGAWLLGIADGLRQATATPLPWREQRHYEQALATIRGALDDTVFSAAWEQGCATPLDVVIADLAGVR